MCFEITSGPTASPKKVPPKGSVTVQVKLRSATPASVTVTCNPRALGAVQSRTVPVDPRATVAFHLNLDNVKPGAYLIEIKVAQTGCPTERHDVGVTVLQPKPAGNP